MTFNVMRDCTICKITVNCIDYLLKKVEFSLKMVPIEGAETGSWE
jgi:hypothetical protein